MMRLLAVSTEAVRPRFGGWLLIALGFVAAYYASLLVALVVRFENLPNYWVGYDWPGNVARIFHSTPSLADALAIAQDEWLLEIGYMNMSFGRGISEWSLTLVPTKMAAILLLGLLLATTWALVAESRNACAARADWAAAAASGLGAGLVGLTGATMTWVVCCATPTWIVGLAMLGVGVATANWLEPAGPYLTLLGYAFLAVAVVRLAARSRQASPGRGGMAGRLGIVAAVTDWKSNGRHKRC
jgi:hypothetical protein